MSHETKKSIWAVVMAEGVKSLHVTWLSSEPRWTAGSAVALYEKRDQKKPWSSRRAILRLIRQLERARNTHRTAQDAPDSTNGRSDEVLVGEGGERATSGSVSKGGQSESLGTMQQVGQSWGEHVIGPDPRKR